MFKARSVALAGTFAVTIAAAATVLTPAAQTRETNTDQACSHETWPAISDQCLTGTRAAAVRVVPIDSVAEQEMRTRFATAFN